MQGKKTFTPQLFISVNLLDLVPADNFRNMKRVNTRGINNANKHVLMANLTYNLKKYLCFIAKKRSVLAQVLALKGEKAVAFAKTLTSGFHNSIVRHVKLSIFYGN